MLIKLQYFKCKWRNHRIADTSRFELQVLNVLSQINTIIFKYEAKKKFNFFHNPSKIRSQSLVQLKKKSDLCGVFVKESIK